MTVMPPSFDAALAQEPNGATGLRWAALAEAASVVATLAGLEPERTATQASDFPELIRDAEPWRRERAEHGVADLAAIMEPGIAALLAVNARGADPRPAATALWREYLAARAAILALLPPRATLVRRGG
jgi:hypothetical protein